MSSWFLKRQLDVAGCAVVGDESTRDSLLKVFMIGSKFFVLPFFFLDIPALRSESAES